MLYNHRMVLLTEEIVKNGPTQVTPHIRDSSPIRATPQSEVKKKLKITESVDFKKM